MQALHEVDGEGEEQTLGWKVLCIEIMNQVTEHGHDGLVSRVRVFLHSPFDQQNERFWVQVTCGLLRTSSILNYILGDPYDCSNELGNLRLQRPVWLCEWAYLGRLRD